MSLKLVLGTLPKPSVLTRIQLGDVGVAERPAGAVGDHFCVQGVQTLGPAAWAGPGAFTPASASKSKEKTTG